MTTLILKLTAAPSFDGFKRIGNAIAEFFAIVAEAKQMAREAQQRHRFVNE
jgi:hypothetical protein